MPNSTLNNPAPDGGLDYASSILTAPLTVPAASEPAENIDLEITKDTVVVPLDESEDVEVEIEDCEEDSGAPDPTTNVSVVCQSKVHLDQMILNKCF